MSDEELAAEIRRCMEAARRAPRLARPPEEPPSPEAMIPEPMTAETITTEAIPGESSGDLQATTIDEFSEELPDRHQETPPAAEAFGYLDGRRMPVDELAAELKRRLDQQRKAHGESGREIPKQVSELTAASAPARARSERAGTEGVYMPVVIPADQVILRGTLDRYEQKIRTTPTAPGQRKWLYVILAGVALAAILVPGSWNAISRYQEVRAPVAAAQPETPPQPAPIVAPTIPKAPPPAKASDAKAATGNAEAERAEVEKAAAEKAAAEKAAAEKAAAEKAAAEKAAAEKALLERAAAARAAEPKVLIPPVEARTPKPFEPSMPTAKPLVPATPSPAASSGGLPKSTPSSSGLWQQPKPVAPMATP